MSTLTLRKGGPGTWAGGAATLRFGAGTVHGLPVWAVLTERGLCSLRLHEAEHDQHCEQLLTSGARAEAAPKEVAQLCRQLEEWLDGRRDRVDTALDLTGTPFQLQVWQELQKIPRGTTVSYTEVAKRVGKPAAVRAVANACGRNPVALLVPCHRVIAKDGGLGGYGGGLDRKRELLAREQRSPVARG